METCTASHKTSGKRPNLSFVEGCGLQKDLHEMFKSDEEIDKEYAEYARIQ